LLPYLFLQNFIKGSVRKKRKTEKYKRQKGNIIMCDKTNQSKGNSGGKTSVKGSQAPGSARHNYTRNDSLSHSAVHKPVPGRGDKNKQ